MSHIISTRVQDELYTMLENIAIARRCKLSEIVQEAIIFYLDEYADYQVALDRLNNHTDEILDESELKKRLGWDK